MMKSEKAKYLYMCQAIPFPKVYLKVYFCDLQKYWQQTAIGKPTLKLVYVLPTNTIFVIFHVLTLTSN